MTSTPGERFARALAAKDVDGMLAVLDPDVDFHAMTPSRFWEATTAKEVVTDVLLGQWFEPHDHIDGIDDLTTGEDVGDRHHVAYRYLITTPDGPHVCQQQAYYETDGERITWLRVMCSGFRPVGA